MSTLQTSAVKPTKAQTRSLQILLSAWTWPLAVAAIWMLLIWSVHRENPRTLVSFHGLLHAAIVEQVLDSDGTTLAPENPFFAGHPVAYYWFFHLLAAQLVRLFGMNVFHAMEALILLATGSLLITAVALGRKLYNNTFAGMLIGYLILAGTNPLGILFALYKVARNGMRALNDDPNYLWGVVHPLYSMIRYNDTGGIYGPLLNFFLNITSRPLALASLLLWVICLYRALPNGRLARWVSLTVAVALTTAFSPIIGFSVGGAMGLALAADWLRGRLPLSAPVPSTQGRPLVFAGLAIISGLLLASPTYYHLITGPSSTHLQFMLFSTSGFRQFLTVTLSILPLVLIAISGLRRAAQDRQEFLGILVLTALALLALSICFSLADGNHSNMFHAAAVLLAVPAAGAILRRESTTDSSAYSVRRAILISLIFLPTLLTLLAAYINRPSIPVSFESSYLERLPRDADYALLYQWARNETDRNAVFIIPPRDRVALCGNTAEFPAMTGRCIFTENLQHYLVAPYPESKTRFEMAIRLVSGEPASESDCTYLASLKRPLFIVIDSHADTPMTDRMKGFYGPPIFQHGQIFAYKWLPQAGASIPKDGEKNNEE